MQNLMMNARWEPGPGGGPMYYGGSGPITYDEFALNGYRSCSLTMGDNGMAFDGYLPYIEVMDRTNLQIVMMVRAIDIEHMEYVVEMFDEDKEMVGEERMEVTNQVNFNFQDVFSTFKIPNKVKYVKVQWAFKGRTTACTFLNPRAFMM